MIKVENLVKQYFLGGTTVKALDHISLTIGEGDMVAITGASGSGKSTLMHILGCLDDFDSGKYFLAGQDVSGLSRERQAEIRNRYIGFVFQTFNLLPRMTALENVALPLLYAGRTHVNDEAEEALNMVGLADRMYHEPNQLSGGQRQRVAIARSIVTNPAIILADEPTGNLDSKTSVEIMELFESLNSTGRSIVIVTHEQDIAAHCNRQIHIKDGRTTNMSEGM